MTTTHCGSMEVGTVIPDGDTVLLPFETDLEVVIKLDDVEEVSGEQIVSEKGTSRDLVQSNDALKYLVGFVLGNTDDALRETTVHKDALPT